MNTIIFPCLYGNINKVDEGYLESEYKIAEALGFNILLFNYDEFNLSMRKLKLNKEITFQSNAVYRGWMLSPEKYTQFYTELLEKGITLINDPQEYINCHEFPYSYSLVKQYTPRTWVFKNGRVDWRPIKQHCGHIFLKDYVKSVKECNFSSCIDCSLPDEELDKYVEEFKRLRGDIFTGGIVIKEFVDLDKTDGITHEFRAYYSNGQLLDIYPNSNNLQDEVPLEFAKSMPALSSSFYTIDFAIDAGGKCIIIETGDGQVSGIENHDYIEKIYNKIKEL